jgi:hypothetical protein
VFEQLKGWRPKAGGKGGTMKARFHAWLHRALVKQVEASWTEQGGTVAFVNPWGTSAWAYDGSGKVVRPAGAHDRAVFTTGKHYDADLNAAYNIASKYWVRRLAENAAARSILSPLLGWDDEAAKTSDKAATQIKAVDPDALSSAVKVDTNLPPSPARRKNGGAAPGRSVPRSRGPRTAPRTPATLSTLWHLARAMQLDPKGSVSKTPVPFTGQTVGGTVAPLTDWAGPPGATF